MSLSGDSLILLKLEIRFGCGLLALLLLLLLLLRMEKPHTLLPILLGISITIYPHDIYIYPSI
jgi:hypothetical protein